MSGDRRRSRTWISAVALVVGLAALPALGHAQNRDPNRELSAAQHDLDEAVGAEASLLADYRASAARAVQLDRQVAALDRQVAAAAAQLALAEAAAATADREAAVTRARATAADARLRASVRRLQEQAISAYIGGPPESLTFSVLTFDSLDQAKRSLVYAESVLEAQRSVVEETKRRGVEAVKLRRAAQVAVVGAGEARDELARQELTLTQARADLAEVQVVAREEATRKKALADKAASTRRAYEKRVAALKAESERLARELKEREAKAKAAGKPKTTAPSQLADPLDRMVITSGFGSRKHPVFGDTRFHYGIDLDGDVGDRVMSSAKGVVVTAGNRGGYGLCVVVDHGGGLATLYGHLSKIAVTAGQTISLHQVVGYMGATGTATGPHLHFEVRVNGTPVDPVPYLP